MLVCMSAQYMQRKEKYRNLIEVNKNLLFDKVRILPAL